MDDNQLDKFFSDRVGQFQVDEFDETSWNQIAQILSDQAVRPPWYLAASQWLISGGKIIYFFLILVMIALLLYLSQQVSQLHSKVDHLSQLNDSIANCLPDNEFINLNQKRVAKDTVWVMTSASGIPLKHYSSPNEAFLDQTNKSLNNSLYNALSSENSSQSTQLRQIDRSKFIGIQKLKTSKFFSSSINEIDTLKYKPNRVEQQKLVPTINTASESKNLFPNAFFQLNGLVGVHFGLKKGYEYYPGFQGGLESEFFFNQKFGVFGQVGILNLEYELEDLDENKVPKSVIDQYPNLPVSLNEGLAQIEMKGSRLIIPFGIKYSFISQKRLHLKLGLGIVAGRYFKQSFSYKYSIEGVEQELLIVPENQDWKLHSVLFSVEGEYALKKNLNLQVLLRHNEDILGIGEEKLRNHLLGIQLGLGYRFSRK